MRGSPIFPSRSLTSAGDNWLGSISLNTVSLNVTNPDAGNERKGWSIMTLESLWSSSASDGNSYFQISFGGAVKDSSGPAISP